MGRRRKTKKKKRRRGGKIPAKEPPKIGEAESDVAEITQDQLLQQPQQQPQQQQQQELLNEPLFTGRRITPEEREQDRQARLAGQRLERRRRTRNRRRRGREGRRRTRRQQPPPNMANFFEEINEGQEEDMEHIANLIANEINEQTNGNLIQQQNEEKENVEEETKTSDEEMPQEGGMGGFDNNDILIIHRIIALHHAGVSWTDIRDLMRGDYGNYYGPLTMMTRSVFNELLRSKREEYGFGGGLEGTAEYDIFIRDASFLEHQAARSFYLRHKSGRHSLGRDFSRGYDAEGRYDIRRAGKYYINRQKELKKIKKELIEIGVEIGKLKEKMKPVNGRIKDYADLAPKQRKLHSRKKKLEYRLSELLDASSNAERREEINIEVKKILDEQLKKCTENIEKAIENYPTCMICMENFKEDEWNKVMICGPNGHPFHDTCILQWLNNQNNPPCPICKQPWFGDPVPVRRNNIRRTQVAPAPVQGVVQVPAQIPDPPGFRERLRRVRDNIRNGAMRLPERIRRQLREHRRRRMFNRDQQTGCVLQGGN